MYSVKEQEEQTYVNNFCPHIFDPTKDILKNAAITVIGKRRSGKSILIRDIVSKIHHNYQDVYLFSGSHAVQGDFWDFIPKHNRFDGLDENKAKELWNKQAQMKITSGHTKEEDLMKLPHILIILDDIIKSENGVRGSNFLSDLYANGRHLNICCILATQSFKKVSKHVRDNTDISISYRFKNGYDDKDFVTENFSRIGNSVGSKIMDKLTNAEDPENGKYPCIVVLNYLNTPDIYKIIKKYEADIKVKKFITGGSRPIGNISKTKVYQRKGNTFQNIFSNC